jgi:hypothetical protein
MNKNKRNTFLSKSNAQKISDAGMQPLLFTYLTTFGSWNLFGTTIIPKTLQIIGENIKNMPLGQGSLGVSLAAQIVGVFSITETLRILYNKAIIKCGGKEQNTDYLIKEILSKQQENLKNE